jgi:phosphohistidine phosphatase
MSTNLLNRQSKIVYLVRHGEAELAAVAPQRPLTAAGRQAVERLAAWAAKMELRVDRILHSGKLRAQQTAEILAAQLQPTSGVVASQGLKPNDDVGFAADLIATDARTLMLVGHLPHLARLVGTLAAGDPDRPIAEFSAGAMVALAQRGPAWSALCVMQPEFLDCCQDDTC